MKAVTIYHAHALTRCLRHFFTRRHGAVAQVHVLYGSNLTGAGLQHSTAFHQLEQVIAEFPIMLNPKSLFALTADPALQGVVQKCVFGRLSKHGNKTCAEENDSKH